MICRHPARAERDDHDLIVVGGGIHGAMVTLEAARRGWKALLLESADFGSGASANSLRIVHGGLRYLQSADIARCRESIRARRWFARSFPDLVEPLHCVMPLYGGVLRSPAILRGALFLNDALSGDRNRAVDAHVRIARGRVLDRRKTLGAYPMLRAAGLRGAAVWTDLAMRSSERILISVLHAACAHGARALNYVRACDLIVHQRRVVGLSAVDAVTSARLEFRARAVVNCTGGEARGFDVAEQGDETHPFPPSLAFNVLLDVEPPVDAGLAVARPERGAAVHFLVPSGRRLLAGTAHAARPAETGEARASEREVAAFVGDLAAAVPSLGLSMRHVVEVRAGLLPAVAPGSTRLATRACIVDHGSRGGAVGLVTLAGIKYTTARQAALAALRCARAALPPPLFHIDDDAPLAASAEEDASLLLDGDAFRSASTETRQGLVERIVRSEAVRTAEDLVARRTNWTLRSRDTTSLLESVRRAMTPETVHECG